MTLQETAIGDFVTVWCIGWGAWDNDTVKVVEKSGLVTVEHRDGTRHDMSPTTQCKKATW